MSKFKYWALWGTSLAALVFSIAKIDMHVAFCADTNLFVAILSVLVTLLVAWNIYNLVDFRESIKIVKELKKRTQDELNYIHNKTDYCQANVYAFEACAAGSILTNASPQDLLADMLLKSLIAARTYSNLNNLQEANAVISIACETLINRDDICIKADEANELNVRLKDITNQNQIERFDELCALIKERTSLLKQN